MIAYHERLRYYSRNEIVAVEGVVDALGLAIVLVLIILFIFLQNWRATVVPSLAIPISLVGTFAFVKIFGFGPFAGFLTLSFATIGFLAKLLAEDIEDNDEAQAEAVRATGAGWWQVVNYGIQPQVMPRLIGLSLYRLDINFRESSVNGIVGAGGIGATLNTAMDRYEYDSAAAILIMIIVIVMLAEYGSSVIRQRVQ